MNVYAVFALLIACLTTLGDDPPRAARSVHLRYPAPEGEIFYNEMTVTRSTPGSYFMACGFGGGYFGIQELADRRKVVIFSVWDPGKQDDPNSVAQDKRVEVLHAHPLARIKRFGGEGTGGQCMFDFDWTIDSTYCFAVRATPGDDRTAFAAYFRPKDSNEWTHLATFRTISGGSGLKNLYSFIEDFRRDTKSVGEIRHATFGNGWLKPRDGGEWTPLTKGQFTASSADFESKDNINAGTIGDRFYLQTGGETKMTTQLKDSFERPSAESTPPILPD